jgi:plastocyanin
MFKFPRLLNEGGLEREARMVSSRIVDAFGGSESRDCVCGLSTASAQASFLSTSPSTASPTPNCANPCTIIIQNSQFGDSSGTTNPYIVTVGTTVIWANHDGTDHTSTSDAGVWGSPVLAPGASFSHTFSSPGVYTYHCNIHPMTGEIIVVP